MTTAEAKQRAYDALLGLKIPVWYEKKGEDSEKYIIIANIDNGEDNLSDDEAGEETHLFYVYCFASGDEVDLLDSYMDSIRNALKSAEFDPGRHNLPTIDDLQSEYTGRYSEFSIWG